MSNIFVVFTQQTDRKGRNVSLTMRNYITSGWRNSGMDLLSHEKKKMEKMEKKYEKTRIQELLLRRLFTRLKVNSLSAVNRDCVIFRQGHSFYILLYSAYKCTTSNYKTENLSTTKNK